MGKKSLADTSKTMERYSEHLQLQAQRKRSRTVSSHEPKTLQYLSPFVFLSVVLLLSIIMLKPGFTGLSVAEQDYEFPTFIHEQAITIPANHDFDVDLDTWFVTDNKPVYSITDTEHLTFTLRNNLMTITPAKDFTGSEITQLLANNHGKLTRVTLQFTVDDAYYFAEEEPTTQSITTDSKTSSGNTITGAFVAITGAVTQVTACQDITVPDTYELVQDITIGGDCFDIQVSDVILDCQDNTLTGAGGGTNAVTISAATANNITITNCDFDAFGSGIEGTGISGDGITITNNKFANLASGIALQGPLITNVDILNNNMQSVGNAMHVEAINVLIQDNNLTSSVAPGTTGLTLQSGSAIDVIHNKFDGFGVGASVNNDLVTTTIFTQNNFTNSQTLHAELWNPAGTIDVHFNASEAGAAAGYEAEGNYWEGQPYTVDDDDDADGFADPAGVTARGVAPALPLDSSTPFTGGFSVGDGVEDYGPLVGMTATPPPPPPPPGCFTITSVGLHTLPTPLPTCVVIQATPTISTDVVSLDCQGQTLQGTGTGVGVDVTANPSENIIVKNCTIDNYQYGIRLGDTINFLAETNNMTNNDFGITYTSSDGSSLQANHFEKNDEAIHGLSSTNLIIQSNTFIENQKSVYLATASSYSLSSNRFINNTESVHLQSTDNGLVDKNNFTRGSVAIRLEATQDSLFEKNYLERQSSFGILTDSATTGNTFTTNEFVENSVQAQDDTVANSNTWNGNYWSDIFSQDLDFLDGDDDHYADSGSNHPYEQSNGGNVLGSVLDMGANINPCHDDVSNDISYNVYLPDAINCPTDGVTFTAPDLFYDCDGVSMSGPSAMTGDIAFTASGRDNITIRECILNDWDIGIVSANSPATGLRVLYNTFNRPGTGVLVSETSIPSLITDTTLFGNTFDNVHSVGVHSASDHISIVGNTLSPTNAALNPVGIEIYGGADYDIRLNTISNFESAILNAILPGTGILTRNNFLQSTALHADYALSSGTPSLQYYLDPATGMVGFREEGNYWSESPYTPSDDTNADMFADQGGATALPLADTTVFSAPFTGAAVATGVEDQGPMVLSQQPTECTDGIDNDMDGFIDMQDPECIADPYGREDGQPIVRCGMILTQDASLNMDLMVNGDCIIIGSNDVTLDCRGYSITGSGSGKGISWVNKDNVEILNCAISQFDTAIEGIGGSDTHLGNNTLFENNAAGFSLIENAIATGNKFIDTNTLSNNPTNTLVASQANNRVYGNTFTSMTSPALEVTMSDSAILGNNFNSNSGTGLVLSTGSQNNNIAYNAFTTTTPLHAEQEDPADVNSWSILALNIFGQQVEQGNLWGETGDGDSAVDLGITDSNSDGFGDTNVPYSSSNPAPGGRVSDGVSDAGPILDPMFAPNVPPQFNGPIPDVSFPKNTIDTSVNLYSYFVDPDQGPVSPLTLGPATSQNFAFSVDPTTGVLSITPDNNFVGCNDVIFTAHDGLVMVQSNTVEICTTGTTFGGSSGGGGGGGGGGSSVQRQCRDGIDNDQDGLIDYPEDPDCYSYFDTLEQGNSTTCDEAWVCQPFSDCVDGQQTRECRDVQSCGTITKRPALTQTCTPPVVEEPVVVPPPAPRTPPPVTPPVQQPPVEQTPWVCSAFLPVGVLFALIVAFIVTALVFVMRWRSQEKKSMAPEVVMWIVVIIPFAMLLTELLVCQTTSLLNWIILLAVVLFAVYVTYYTSHLPKPAEDEEEHMQPLADFPEESYTPPPAALREVPILPAEKPVERDMEPAYVVEEEPEERKPVMRERAPQRMPRHPEVYLVPRTQERPLPEHRRELRQIKKDLDALKKERQSSTKKEKISMDKIDHFLNEMEDIKRDLTVVPIKEPAKPAAAAPSRKKTVKKAKKKTVRKATRKSTRKK